ncbi:MAG: hypothetical protein L3J31_06160 [Bacteroidales bacterium]|nr:hypothetical protein [Bacteroidales bacterium]
MAALIVLLLTLMLILPLVFEDKIEELAREEINNNVNATVDFKDISLSLFRNFPNFTLGIDGLSITGKDVFENDTLVLIDNISLTLDLFSVISGDSYELSRIVINTPQLKVRILDNGLSNYNISLPDEPSGETSSGEAPKSFKLRLKSIIINNGRLVYVDGESELEVFASGLQASLSGDLTADATALNIKTAIEKLTVNSSGISYLTNSKLRYKAKINADLKNEIYTFGGNELLLNELLLNFGGSISFIPEGMNLALTFDTPQNKFKSLLSLVPVIYARDFEGLDANGDFSLSGNVKGVYTDEKLPSFNIDMTVNKAYFKYPGLPRPVDNISIKAKVSNPGGTADATLVNISNFTMTPGDNTVSTRMKIKTPVSDPDIDGKFNGEIDLSAIKDYYPLENGDALTGLFVFDLTLKGKMSFIEKEQYDKFIALGSMLVKEVKYKSSAFNQPVAISHAQLNFSPQYLDLVSFKMKAGSSDLNASGKVENYLGYVLAGATLKGKLKTESIFFNLDELLADEEKEGQTETSNEAEGRPGESTSETAWKVPEKVDFTLSSGFGKLIYDKLEMKNVNGKIIISDETIRIQGLRSEIIGGKMTVNGTYSTRDMELPKVDFRFDMKDIDIAASYDHFALVRQYMPVAKKTNGKLSAGFTFNTSLDNAMMPVYESLNGKGILTTTKITVDGLNTLEQIAGALSIDALKKLTLEKMKVSFRFINGKMITKPFKLKYKNMTGEIEGWTALDESIGYVMTMNIPRGELGPDANKLMDELVKEAGKLGVNYELPETIKVGITVGGTLSRPEMKTDRKQSSNELVKKAKEEIVKELGKELNEQALKILADADKASKKIMAEAKKQADALRRNADDAIRNLNRETDKQAAVLMEEARKQGALAEFAAREAIKKIRSESNKQIDSLRDEADKKSDAILKEAKKQSDRIKKEARQQSDALLKK